MKKTALILFSAFLLGKADAQKNITGTWEGRLSAASTSLRLVIHIKADKDGGYSALLDSPDQGAKDIPVSRIQMAGDSLYVEIATARATVSGILTSDSTFSGEWQQGASLPLELKKQSTVTPQANLLRPQTPTPPFPYQSLDVVYNNKDKSIRYGATVTKPKGKGPFPALLLLTGSGPQNRDEELFGHKPFAVIADYLTRRGYLVLRADDRGVGQTTGNREQATSEDFATDAVAGINYLRSLPDVDKGKIGLLGHSEGGMIAQIVAAQRNDIAFVIMLAAPGQQVIDLMTGQNKAILQSAGLPPATVKSYAALYKPLVSAIAFSNTDSAAFTAATRVVDAWLLNAPKETVMHTTGISDEESKKKFVRQFVSSAGSPWFRYFLRYKPDDYVRKMKARVLALNGDRDIQVLSGANLAALKTSLQKSRVKNFDVIELKGLNHLFQQCKTCTINEYAQLEETIAPQALATIGSWLAKHIK